MLDAAQVKALWPVLHSRMPEGSAAIRRTVLVKVDRPDFLPDPMARSEIKVKLIDSDTVLSIKRGSWHGDATREEFDIPFARTDLENVLGGLRALGWSRFVLMCTRRRSWTLGGLIYSIDEYRFDGRALLEIQSAEPDGEGLIDEAFSGLGLTPMDSPQTIACIGALNRDESIQIDLDKLAPEDVAGRMRSEHDA